MVPWIGFHIFLLAALAVDLGIFHRKAHAVKFKEALAWSGVWFFLALIFNAGVYHFKGPQAGIDFLTGYLIEWSLSVDNLFVFLTIFTAFKVPSQYQHRILFWGILGALFMRAAFIFLGIAILNEFHWVIYIFGGFLIFTGVKLLFGEKEEEDPKNHWAVRFAKKYLPFTDTLDEGRFLTVSNGKRVGTPLLLVLIIVEVTDLIFAADSIPAILAVTNDSFIVYTSNVFAILGLRSLYFALAGMMGLFRFLKYGLSGILIFVGIKLAVSGYYKIPSLVSLGVIVFFLVGAVVASLLVKPEKK